MEDQSGEEAHCPARSLRPRRLTQSDASATVAADDDAMTAVHCTAVDLDVRSGARSAVKIASLKGVAAAASIQVLAQALCRNYDRNIHQTEKPSSITAYNRCHRDHTALKFNSVEFRWQK